MKQITNEDLQRCELEILQSVATFCENQGLRYSIAYGSLIGAIRHKGFIPWDDDMDIVMPRKDYEIFLSTYKHDRFYIGSVEFDENWPYPFAKCIDDTIILDEHIRGCKPIGAYIDIFPLDGLPNDKIEIEKVYKRVVSRWKILSIGFRQARNKDVKNPIRIIGRYVRTTACYLFRKQIIRKMIESAKKYDYDSSEYVGNQTLGTYGLRNALEKGKLGGSTQVTFEGRIYKAFQGYDYYLRHIYGDYMKIPDKEHQVKHFNDISWNLMKFDDK